jgi:nucleoid-associated protein YgaU
MDWFSEIGGDAWELRGTYKAVKISKTDWIVVDQK